MERFNEILSGRFNRALQKVFSMKGPAPAPQLGGEIMPTFAMQSGCENYVLQSVEKFGLRFLVGASAGNNGNIQLRNPLGSNVVAVIEKLSFENTAAEEILFFIQKTSVDLTSVLPLAFQRFDARGRNNPTLIASQAAGGIPAVTFYWSGAHPANSMVDMVVTDIQEFPLLPGDAFQCTSTIVNQSFVGSVWWRERALESSEVSQ
jgi:hypothetical protein